MRCDLIFSHDNCNLSKVEEPKFEVKIIIKCEIKIHLVMRLSPSLCCFLSFFFPLPGIARSQEAVVMVINANAHC